MEKLFRQGCQNWILRVQRNILAFSKKFSKHERTSVKNVNAIGKHWVKKAFALNGRFSSHIVNMAETDKLRPLNEFNLNALIGKAVICYKTRLFGITGGNQILYS